MATATEGNHGRALAWAARQFGIPAVVFLLLAIAAFSSDTQPHRLGYGWSPEARLHERNMFVLVPLLLIGLALWLERPERLRTPPLLGAAAAATVLPAVTRVLKPGGTIVALVKPQFEVGRGRVGKGGVVRDPALRAEAVASVRAVAERLGLEVRGEAESALPGPKGNREVFLRLGATRDPCLGSEPDASVKRP